MRSYKYRTKIGQKKIPLFFKIIGELLFPLLFFGIVKFEIYIGAQDRLYIQELVFSQLKSPRDLLWGFVLNSFIYLPLSSSMITDKPLSAKESLKGFNTLLGAVLTVALPFR